MAAFAAGEVSVLVATTVVEVGVNVPAATIMVIEHAERFGLAQLHQLRGRVGRGADASACLLLYDPPLSATGQARLEVLRETEDGFLIAEKDLELRGGRSSRGAPERPAGLPLRRPGGAPRPAAAGRQGRPRPARPRPDAGKPARTGRPRTAAPVRLASGRRLVSSGVSVGADNTRGG